MRSRSPSGYLRREVRVWIIGLATAVLSFLIL